MYAHPKHCPEPGSVLCRCMFSHSSRKHLFVFPPRTLGLIGESNLPIPLLLPFMLLPALTCKQGHQFTVACRISRTVDFHRAISKVPKCLCVCMSMGLAGHAPDPHSWTLPCGRLLKGQWHNPELPPGADWPCSCRTAGCGRCMFTMVMGMGLTWGCWGDSFSKLFCFSLTACS